MSKLNRGNVLRDINMHFHRAVLLAMIPDALIVTACFANGLALYAYFEDCDPLLNGELEKVEQSLPYLALKVFQGIPGMTGIFISSVFSATLRSIYFY